MRTRFIQCNTKYMAKKLCDFTPAIIAKVCEGFMCFECEADYKVWKNQK